MCNGVGLLGVDFGGAWLLCFVTVSLLSPNNFLGTVLHLSPPPPLGLRQQEEKAAVPGK